MLSRTQLQCSLKLRGVPPEPREHSLGCRFLVAAGYGCTSVIAALLMLRRIAAR